ncbi:MAG: NapC/NirT family cytochrome c [Phycisphaerae bacterium]|nr:NapC/NirT family cytochrome c [Phycisphaerae bacterium]
MATLKKIFIGVKKHKVPFILGFLAAVAGFFILEAAMKPVSTSKYCGTQCHEMNTAYRSWELSAHGTNIHGLQAQCVDCHLPPKEEHIDHLVSKGLAGAKDMYMHKFGGEYDGEAMRKKIVEHFPSERCLHCHKNLLDKPGSSAARMAHTSAINDTDKEGTRCVDCHENVGHERQAKLFSE